MFDKKDAIKFYLKKQLQAFQNYSSNHFEGLQSFFRPLKNQSLSWPQKISHCVQTSQRWAEVTNERISAGLKKVFAGIKKRVTPFSSLYQKTFKIPYEKFQAYAYRGAVIVKDYFQKKHQHLLMKLRQARERLKNRSYDPSLERFAQQAFFAFFPSKFRESIRKIVINPLMQGLIKSVQIVYQRLFLTLLSGCIVLMDGLEKLCRKLGTHYAQSKKWLSTSKQKMMHFFCLAGNLLGRGLDKSIYYFLVLIVMLMILSLWSASLLGDAMKVFMNNFKSLFVVSEPINH
jgi:hypothetical protein